MEGDIFRCSRERTVSMLEGHYSAYQRGPSMLILHYSPLFCPCHLKPKKVSLLVWFCFSFYSNIIWCLSHSSIRSPCSPMLHWHHCWGMSIGEWQMISWLDTGSSEVKVYALQSLRQRVEDCCRIYERSVGSMLHNPTNNKALVKAVLLPYGQVGRWWPRVWVHRAKVLIWGKQEEGTITHFIYPLESLSVMLLWGKTWCFDLGLNPTCIPYEPHQLGQIIKPLCI